MNTPRTRLSPGSPWLHSSAPTPSRQPDAAATGARAPSPAHGARAVGQPAASPLAAPPMAGVEVNEFDSDTLFDRFFGPQTPGSTGRR